MLPSLCSGPRVNPSGVPDEYKISPFKPARGLIVLSLFFAGCAASSKLSSIQITPDTATINALGGSVQFKAIGTYSRTGHPSDTRDITNEVTWTSSNVGTASVNSTGMATAVASGTTSISATMKGDFGPVVGTADLQVTVSGTGGTPPGTRDLTAIMLIPSNLTINGIGNGAQFTALGTFSAAPTTQSLTNVTWQSTNPSVATINSAGLATAIACPTSSCNTTITATSTAQSGATIVGTGQLTVVPTGGSASTRDLTGITIIPGSQTISGSGSVQFLALGTYSAAPTAELLTNVNWQSSYASVAAINSSGLATAGTCGTSSCVTTITATATAPISGATIVSNPPAQLTFAPTPGSVHDLTQITLIPATGMLNGIGSTLQMIPIGTYSPDSTTGPVSGATWSSNSPSVAQVDSSGLVTAISCATTSCSVIITATALGSNGNPTIATAQLTVDPSPPAQVGELTGLNVMPLNGQNLSAAGDTAQFLAIGTFNTIPSTKDVTNSSPQIQWRTSSTSVATVDSSGLASAVSEGTATITATYTNADGTAISAGSTLTIGGGAANVTPSLIVSVVGTGAGTVSSSGGEISNCSSSGGTCTAKFVLGQTVTLTATPSSNFAGWSSNCTPATGHPEQCTIGMGGDQSVGAIFN